MQLIWIEMKYINGVEYTNKYYKDPLHLFHQIYFYSYLLKGIICNHRVKSFFLFTQ